MSVPDKEVVSSHGFTHNQLILWRYAGHGRVHKVVELTGHQARVLHMAQYPDGTTIVSAAADETQPAPASSLEQAPDMYVIRTDGFTCTREEVEDGMLKISHQSTQQLVLVWRKPQKRILVLKKLGPALLPQLVEVSHAMLSMGFEVVVEENVVGEMWEEKAARDAARR